MINIQIASPHGFCFGIEKAINLATETAKNYPQKIYFLGELVHNQHVVDWLESELKIKTVQSLNEIPTGSVVIIRAHGAPPSVYSEAKNKGLEIVDASCPLVLKSHQIVKDLAAQNKNVIFLCNKIDHEETIGVVGEAPDFITPVTLTDIFNFEIKDPINTVVVTQTTLSTTETAKVFDFLKTKYPDLIVQPHICQATTDRQKAILDIANGSDLIIIIGAKNSSNSQSLYQVAASTGVTSYIIESAVDLDPNWFSNISNVAISSGASTPENLLEDVVEKIKNLENT